METIDQPTAAATTQPPEIGQHWPEHGGIYCGFVRAQGDQLAGHLVLHPDAAPKRLAWKDAIAWAEGLPGGWHLPTRWESALLYVNAQEHLDTSGWYWTSTPYADGDSNAWGQTFDTGGQGYSDKSFEAKARAVRLIHLTA